MPGLAMQTHCSPDFPFKVNEISLHAASSLQCPHQLTLGPQLSRMKKADNGLKQILFYDKQTANVEMEPMISLALSYNTTIN